MARQIKLGERVRDTISGFEGLCYGITDWMNGCRRIAIKPTELDKDGNPKEMKWFDEPEVERVTAARLKEVRKTGGPRPDPCK